MDFLTVSIVTVTADPKVKAVHVEAGGQVIRVTDGRSSLTESGSTPYDLLLAGLGACTAIALQSYGAKRGWEITALKVVMRMTRSTAGLQILRTISIEGVNRAQKASLARIADRTPVTVTLRSGAEISTTFD